jgi:hypothetical protein
MVEKKLKINTHKQKEEPAKQKIKQNNDIYKYITFTLVALIIIAGLFYAFTSYSSYRFTQGAIYGQQVTLQATLNSIEQNGYLSITNNNQTLNLVPAESIELAKKQTIIEIMELVKENGYVNLYNNETEIILIEHKE